MSTDHPKVAIPLLIECLLGGVENSCHWVLDVVFREDDCRIRVGNAAENLSTLRRLAMNLLRHEKTDK